MDSNTPSFLVLQSPSAPLLDLQFSGLADVPFGTVHIGSRSMFAKKTLSPPAFKALGKPTEQYRVKNVEVNVWIPAKSGKPTLTTALVQSEKEYVFIFDTDEQAVREILQSIEALN